MASRSRRALRFLPFVALVGGVIAYLVLSATESRRTRAEREIRARWGTPSELGNLPREIERYLSEYGDVVEARWFAAEAFARVGAFPRAHAAVWEHPAVARDPRTPRRVALLLLERIAVGPAVRNMLSPRALHVRAETDGPDAVAALRAYVALPELGGGFRLAYESAARSGQRGRSLLAEAFRQRSEPQYRIAAATLTAGPRRRESVDELVAALASPAVREEPAAMLEVLRALGTSKDARALDALRSLRDAVDRGEIERPPVEVALALAEDPDAAAWVADALSAGRLSDADAAAYGIGLGVQLAQQDSAATPALVALWEASPGGRTRLALASGVLLGDDPPPATIPVARWIGDLRRSEALLEAFADAYAWRTREPGVRDVLVAKVGRLLADPSTTGPDADGLSGTSGILVELLRAWAREM